ncbi:hypothetical protein DPMN_074674 [Dreissena polymorpha]|uniref:Uncharacterized protein n=1 Tax=Dreissena polymorpha TaxID=45954 RepID=A0A9D3YJ32_DREPO|nr:hypothetical protein DPMN_074674 [Dreissena polymorpha]
MKLIKSSRLSHMNQDTLEALDDDRGCMQTDHHSMITRQKGLSTTGWTVDLGHATSQATRLNFKSQLPGPSHYFGGRGLQPLGGGIFAAFPFLGEFFTYSLIISFVQVCTIFIAFFII